jgi:hypothetical protein
VKQTDVRKTNERTTKETNVKRKKQEEPTYKLFKKLR